MNLNPIKIGSKPVGPGHPTYFIADIAANHDGSLDRAKKLIELAKSAGADAVKFQHHNVDKYVSNEGFLALGSKMSHQKSWGKSIFEVYKDAEVPIAWSDSLVSHCQDLEIEFFTTPYDLDIVDELDYFVPAYKIGSGDLAWDDMLIKVASKQKPVLFATGASTLEEVIHAHNILFEINPHILLMQCNTNYTGSRENFKYINLNVLKTYRTLFPSTVLGLSDHTPGHETVLGAIALGASAIEKHFTDDNARKGPDHPFSMNPIAWRQMVDSSRLLENALGSTLKKVEQNEVQTVVLQRRAIRASRDIGIGETLSREMIEYQRPCPVDALTPNDFSAFEGRSFAKVLLKGDHLSVDLFDK